MRSLVMLQDLVDLVEHPLGGSSIVTTLGQPKGEVMELDDDDDEEKGEDMSGGQHNPREVNLRLG